MNEIPIKTIDNAIKTTLNVSYPIKIIIPPIRNEIIIGIIINGFLMYLISIFC